MTATVDALGRPTKTRLARVTVYQVELSPHDDARTRFLALVHHERAVLEAEVVVYFLKQPVKKKT